MRIIDTHPHVISLDTARFPPAPLGGVRSAWSEERPVSWQRMILDMDGAGIEKAALVQASSCYGHDNSYVAEAIAAHPTRFTGVMSVDVRAPDACERIRHWHARGFTGLRLFTVSGSMAQATWLDDPAAFPAWTLAEELDLTVCVQMRVTALPQFQTVLHRFPHVRVIMDHMMRPPVESGPPYPGARGLFDLAGHPNVHLKLTVINVRDLAKAEGGAEPFLRQVVGLFGARRIAWGSDYSGSTGTLGELLADCDQAVSFLSLPEREEIFFRTAQRLYPALADG